MGCSKSDSEREVYSGINLPEETETISTLHLKEQVKE